MSQMPELPDPLPDEDGPERERDDDRAPAPTDDERGPIMEAPGAETGTQMEAASWNPAQGDRSFGYGAGGAVPGSTVPARPAAEGEDSR